MQGAHCFNESRDFKRLGRKWKSLRIQGTRTQAEQTATLGLRPDYIRAFLVFSKTVYDHCSAIREYGLNTEFPPTA